MYAWFSFSGGVKACEKFYSNNRNTLHAQVKYLILFLDRISKRFFVDKKNRLVWIDLEMTGLNAQEDFILEFAMIITDNNLALLHTGPEAVIHQSESALSKMDAWVRKHHTKSGLLAAVVQSKVCIEDVEQEALAIIQKHCAPQEALLCGNSIWQDALFLRRYMPKLMQFLHYRMIDVSSIKEVIRRWYPDDKQAHFVKSDTHRALKDIEESIGELAHYRKIFFK
jgi:oligoribonuclease